MDRDRSPQRAHRRYTGGTGGPSPNFPKLGKVGGNHFLKGVLGETGFPKGLLGTIQSIPVTGNPILSILETFPKQNHVLGSPGFAQNIAQAESGARFGILGPIWDSGSQKMFPGPKTKKMRAEKPCRTPPPEFEMEPYGASYGPKPFWAFGPQNLVQPGDRGADGAQWEQGAYLKSVFVPSNTGRTSLAYLE